MSITSGVAGLAGRLEMFCQRQNPVSFWPVGLASIPRTFDLGAKHTLRTVRVAGRSLRRRRVLRHQKLSLPGQLRPLPVSMLFSCADLHDHVLDLTV